MASEHKGSPFAVSLYMSVTLEPYRHFSCLPIGHVLFFLIVHYTRLHVCVHLLLDRTLRLMALPLHSLFLQGTLCARILNLHNAVKRFILYSSRYVLEWCCLYSKFDIVRPVSQSVNARLTVAILPMLIRCIDLLYSFVFILFL